MSKVAAGTEMAVVGREEGEAAWATEVVAMEVE